jgi:hypothetical protein
MKVIDFAAAVLPVWEVRLATTSKNVLEAKGVQIITWEKIGIATSNLKLNQARKLNLTVPYGQQVSRAMVFLLYQRLKGQKQKG